ncbi:MAG: TIGR00282 family metallophosphoesterase [Candidatus Omnitrophota bacterium]
MKILVIGDIVGSPGRKAVQDLLPHIVKENQIEFCIANGENAAGGSGITLSVADELFAAGVNVITSGDHIWKKKEIIPELDRNYSILRPANYPAGAPGVGATVAMAKNGKKIGVINLLGRVFMATVECPFRTATGEIEKMKDETNIIVVDMHAEATSEKVALGWYLDGKVSAVFGTHTHVPTADEKILPHGAAYITDIGMTGPQDSVIGRNKEHILSRFLTQLPTKFEVANSDVWLQGIILDIDEKTGRANAITRIKQQNVQ